MPAISKNASSELQMDMRTSCPSVDFSDLNADALRHGVVHPELTRLTGRGVVCCIIDYGFDQLHPSLRHADGATRFAHLIDQNGATLDRRAINRLIRQCDPSGRREPVDAIYDPHANYFGSDGVIVGAHGSWVASIAAGSRSAKFTGVAPEATLVGVQLALPDDAWRETCLESVLSGGAGGPQRTSRWRWQPG